MAAAKFTPQEHGQLFQAIVHDELQRSEPQALTQLGIGNPEELSLRNNTGEIIGTIRRVADNFSESRERQQAHDLAERTNIRGLTSQDITSLFSELLRNIPNAVFLENVLVAAYYCCQLIRKIFKAALPQLKSFFNWCKSAFTDIIGPAVENLGGWAKVLTIGAVVVGGSLVVGGIFLAAGISLPVTILIMAGLAVAGGVGYLLTR